MGRVHFIGGEKGGVGKSLISRLLAQYFIDSKMPFIGFDSDQSHGTFSRFYSEYVSPINVDEYDSLDGIIEIAEKHSDHDIIIDLAAQTSSRLEKWIEESDAFTIFEDISYKTFLWHVMDDGLDSMNLLGKLLDNYLQQNIQFVVVQNIGCSDSFNHFEKSLTFHKAQERNAHFLTIGKLQTKLVQKVDFNHSSFWAAANDREVMGIAERQRVRVWLNKSYKQIDSLLEKNTMIESM